MMILPVATLALGWLLASTIGTYAYFANDSKNKSNQGYTTNAN